MRQESPANGGADADVQQCAVTGEMSVNLRHDTTRVDSSFSPELRDNVALSLPQPLPLKATAAVILGREHPQPGAPRSPLLDIPHAAVRAGLAKLDHGRIDSRRRFAWAAASIISSLLTIPSYSIHLQRNGA